MNPAIAFYARLSLAFLWIFTALTSAFFDRATGHQILACAQINGSSSDQLINIGSLLDAGMGIWLLSGKQLKWACWLQLGIIITYSILVSVIAPSYWLHPFGPVTKNLPIIVLIYGLAQTDSPAI